MYKYIRKGTYFNDFCKNFQGKFFFKGLHQFSTINCTYSYKSLPLGIFFNSYLVKAHCVMVKASKQRRPRRRRRKTRAKKKVHIIPMGRIARRIQRGQGKKKKRKATRKSQKSRNSPRLNPSVMGLMESAKAESHSVPQTNLALYRAKLV